MKETVDKSFDTVRERESYTLVNNSGVSSNSKKTKIKIKNI